MGHLEMFAQRTFAEETERITNGAVGWQDPPEIRLEKVQIMSLVALCVVVGDLIRRDAGVLEVTAHSCWLTADEVWAGGPAVSA